MRSKNLEKSIMASITCLKCGAEAGRVELVPRGPRRPWKAGSPRSVGDLDDPTVIRLLVDTPGLVSTREWASREQVVELAGAIERGDAALLHDRMGIELPFYCPACRASYCIDHWSPRIVWDEEYPGWYDYTEGVCPERHRRTIDD